MYNQTLQGAKEASWWARFNSSHNFGVSTPLVVKIDIKQIIWLFLEISDIISGGVGGGAAGGPKGPQPSAGARRKGMECPELLV